MPTIVTKAEFARLRGVHPSSVTKWARDGRIVLTANGCVLVEPSLERLRATAMNIGAAERWREYRRRRSATPALDSLDELKEPDELESLKALDELEARFFKVLDEL
jgi:DNA-binding transcriptional regulator YdaS (Cro superfamily)